MVNSTAKGDHNDNEVNTKETQVKQREHREKQVKPLDWI